MMVPGVQDRLEQVLSHLPRINEIQLYYSQSVDLLYSQPAHNQIHGHAGRPRLSAISNTIMIFQRQPPRLRSVELTGCGLIWNQRALNSQCEWTRSWPISYHPPLICRIISGALGSLTFLSLNAYRSERQRLSFDERSITVELEKVSEPSAPEMIRQIKGG